MGSFVPAAKAKVGVVDHLFAGVGASDNVAKHMSIFHMEMTETANILNNAMSRSFVILDEIGEWVAIFLFCGLSHHHSAVSPLTQETLSISRDRPMDGILIWIE